MSLSIGIVGLPNVGKSTLFNALAKKKVAATNYPFCTINPNVGIVQVPDDRLGKIGTTTKPQKVTPTTIEFIDIAGLVKDAHKGEGLGNQFLSHIRECDAICEVIREFVNDKAIHVHGKIDPASDRETVNLELVMADLATVEKLLAKVTKEFRTGEKGSIKLKSLLERLKTNLGNGTSLREMEFTKEEKESIKSLNLLTGKPIIYVLNKNDRESKQDFKNWDGEILKINAKLEEEVAELPEEEQKEYMEELGLGQSGLDKFIKASYKLLRLITFFTIESAETRAWTVRQGAKASQAAGKIHTDMEEGFIRAEVINWQKFVEAGGEQAAREKGLVRTEGKDYIVQDGDICRFLFSK